MNRINRILYAYLLAILLFWAFGGVSLGKSAYYTAQNLRPNAQELSMNQLDLSSIIPRLEFGENAYVSTDSDSHLYWNEPAYLETITLKATHNSVPLSVVLYWKTDSAADYAERNTVYATKTAEGEYTFDLGGKFVQGIRIDPDSAGGVITWFDGIVLNPQTPWYTVFVPSATQSLLLILLPLLAAAIWQEIASVWQSVRKKA